jgi:hypothetical protein
VGWMNKSNESESFIDFFFDFFSLLSFRLDPFVLSVLLQPLDNSLSVSSSVVVNGVSSLILAPELESRESLDVDSAHLVFSGVNLHQQDVGVVGESLGSLVVVGSQSLAVTAPGGVELNEDLFVRIDDVVFPAFSDHNLNGLVVSFGDRSRLQEGLNLSTIDFLDEGSQVVNSHFLRIVSVLGLLAAEEEDLGGGRSINSQILTQPVVKSVSVVLGGDGQNKARVGGIKGLEGIKSSSFGSLIPNEDEECVVAFLENLFNGVVVEGDYLCEGDGHHEGDQENKLHF